jgi:adenylate cyclase
VLEEIEAAGLLDPLAPDADLRRAATQILIETGVSLEDVIEILRSGDLEHATNTRLLFPGPRLDTEEFAARVGLTVEQLGQIRLAAGLSPLDPTYDERVFSTRDEATFAAFNAGVALFGEKTTLQFIRVMGSALSQVAEAAVALFGPLSEQAATPDEQFRTAVVATQALAGVGTGLDTLFRFHAETAIRRLGRAREGVASFQSARLVVGFVDLVGFTPLAERVDARELSELFDEFEALAFDVIAAHDARLVKLIGDAIMFTAFTVDDACDIALTLVEQFSGDSSPVTPRGALAAGEMLVRGGDYYGPVVNLAARGADLAVPYEILASEDVVAGAGVGFRFEPAGRRLLKGFAAPVALASITRAESTDL